MSQVRQRFILALALVGILVLAACQTATPTPTAVPTDPPTVEPTVVAVVPTEEVTEEALVEVEPTEEVTLEVTPEVTIEAAMVETTPEATDEPMVDGEPTEEPTAEMTPEATEEPMVEAEPVSIIDTAEAAGSFSVLLAAVEAAGLTETLAGEGTFTVFAPTDEAFAAALEALDIEAADLLADTETLTAILLYHVVGGEVLAEAILGAEEFPLEVETLNGALLSVDVVDGAVVINGLATVVAADVIASNGVIHVIDAVLLPPAAEEPMMEMTPEVTDEPMVEMTPEVVEEPMMEMTPEVTDEPMVEMTPEVTDEPMVDAEPVSIVDTADAAGSFTVLLAALEAAELTETLAGEGTFTVFAPTDDAFAALLEQLEVEAADLLANESLSDILLYHVLDSVVLSEAILAAEEFPIVVETLNGESISIALEDDAVVINGVATVIAADVIASNGVIHVIDAVLLPPADEAEAEMTPEATAEAMVDDEEQNIVETADTAAQFTVLLAALDAAELTETLSGEGTFTVFAPNDDAFAAALEALDITAEELLADTEALTAILLYHVLDSEVLSEVILAAEEYPLEVETLNGATISITVEDGFVIINETVRVIAEDIIASNGVIHVIDGVLLPPAEDAAE